MAENSKPVATMRVCLFERPGTDAHGSTGIMHLNNDPGAVLSAWDSRKVNEMSGGFTRSYWPNGTDAPRGFENARRACLEIGWTQFYDGPPLLG